MKDLIRFYLVLVFFLSILMTWMMCDNDDNRVSPPILEQHQ